MKDNNRKMIWALIQKKGDELKFKLKPLPNHPKGRNPYAHICSIINEKFGCSYKDVKDDQIDFLKNFIMDIDDWIGEDLFYKGGNIMLLDLPIIQISDTMQKVF